MNISTATEAISAVMDIAGSCRSFTFFTMNLDHLVKLREPGPFRDAYHNADFVSADGWPVVALANRDGGRIELTTGSDLVMPLCAAAAAADVGVCLFGSTDGSLALAASRIARACPGIVLSGIEAPPLGFDPESPEADAAAARISESGAGLVFVALGAPKQEIFAARVAGRHPGLGLICVGAGLDFLSGRQSRAPVLVRHLKLEWFWRLAHDPRHLSMRYVRCAWLLLGLTLKDLHGLLYAR